MTVFFRVYTIYLLLQYQNSNGSVGMSISEAQVRVGSQIILFLSLILKNKQTTVPAFMLTQPHFHILFRTILQVLVPKSFVEHCVKKNTRTGDPNFA